MTGSLHMSNNFSNPQVSEGTGQTALNKHGMGIQATNIYASMNETETNKLVENDIALSQ